MGRNRYPIEGDRIVRELRRHMTRDIDRAVQRVLVELKKVGRDLETIAGWIADRK